MKKIKLFALTLLCLSFALSVSGQTYDETKGLITSADQLSSTPTTSGHGVDKLVDGDVSTYWRTEGSEGGGTPMGTQYLQVQLMEEYGALLFEFTRRSSATRDFITLWGIYGVPSDNPEAEKEECTFLAERYTPFGVSSETLMSTPFNSKGFTILRFYVDGTTDEENGYTHMAEFQLYECLDDYSDFDLALLDLQDIYTRYADYRYTFTTGTGPGEYDADAVDAFYAALDAAAAVFEDPDASSVYTAEDLAKIGQDIEDAYEVVLASQVTPVMILDEGYYFLVSADTYSDGLTKAMYSEVETPYIYAKWDTFEESRKFLWKVTDMGDGKYSVVSEVTGATFAQVHGDTEVEMLTDSETLETNLVVFEYSPDGITDYACLRISWQQADYHYYLNCASLTGTEGYIVGGYNTSASGKWYPVRVSDEEAQSLIGYSNDAEAIIEDAEEKMAIANTWIKDGIDYSNGLLVSTDQLTSTPTTSGHGPDQLLDGDASTYWRTEGDVGVGTSMGTQYLQAVLPYECKQIYFEFTYRASGTRDFPTQWGVYGVPSDKPDADKFECTFLAEIYTPYDSSRILTSDIFDTQGFTIIRFYVDGTTDEENGYTHLGEFQVYEAYAEKVTQATVMGDIYTNLEEAVAVAKEELAGAGITDETFETLKTAYDAFIAVFVDPTELHALIVEANTAIDGFVVGTDPGYWSDSSAVTDLASVVSEADAYDAACVYTQKQTDDYTATLQGLIDAVFDAAIKVETGKWYMIRYATEEEVAANGWVASNGAANDANESLFGKYVTVASGYSEDDFNYVEYVTESDLSSICAGHSLYFDEKIDIVYDDYAKFRFINVGDTAYMVQNKATGLFLTTNGTHAAVSLTPQPSLFDVSAIGYGENLLAASTLDGETHRYLNAQLTYNLLITNSATTAGSNSGFYIEDIGESVAADYDGTAFNLSMPYGSLRTYCYPVSITAVDGTMYGVEVDGTTVTLHPMGGNTAEAGQPFVFIVGDLDSYDEEAESEPIPFTHGYDIAREAQSSGALVGSYYEATIGSGKLVASGNSFAVSNSSTTLSANRAYVNGTFSSADVIVIEFSDETFDGIEQAAVASVPLEGSIYSTDGKLLGKGNLNTVRSFGKGIYIINGVKVAVK